MDAYPVLYSFRRCPYAMRARLALSISGQVCELREVVLRDKPQEMLEASPKGTVPVLIEVNGSMLEESLDIMIWALSKRDPQEWLRPAQSAMAEIRELITECDGNFKHHLDRYKYAQRYENVDSQSHRAEGAKFLKKLEDKLTMTAYLYDQRLSIADMAIAPFVRQFANADRTWFDAQPWPYLHKWLAAFLDSELFCQIMTKYPQWKSGQAGVLFPGS